jgi:hypothetical protein
MIHRHRLADFPERIVEKRTAFLLPEAANLIDSPFFSFVRIFSP